MAEPTRRAALEDAGEPRPSDTVIGAFGFLSFWDRFGLPPMLIVLTQATGLSLAQAVQLLTVYTLLYAIGQPLWGMLSDRLGRVRVLRIAMVGGTVGALASVVTDGYASLLVARGLTGLMVGCLYPTMLTLIGDTRSGARRVHSLSSLQAWSALGNTLTTVLAGSLAALVSWRLVFGITAVGMVALLYAIRRVPVDPPAHKRPSVKAAVTPWALTLYFLAAVEGAVMFGALAYVVPAMQQVGLSVGAAGLLAAVYGVGIIGGSFAVRRFVTRPDLARTRMMLVGGAVLVVGLASGWLVGSPAALAVTAAMIGLANAVLHVSLQGWATEVAPAARATSVSFFAGSLFLGSSLATFVTAHLADAGRFDEIFGAMTVAAVGLTLAAATMYRRFVHLPGVTDAGGAR